MNGKRWCIRFLACALAAVAALGALCYLIDPFMQYRARDHKYYLNARFVSPGLVRHYDYDTAVMGSSLTQNFNMDSFRTLLGASPLKVTLGGMNATEIVQMHTLIKETGKAERVYLCLPTDLQLTGASNYPAYLLDGSPLNDYRYLLGYEAWLRYIPTDLALLALDGLGVALPAKFDQARSIDYLEYWADDRPVNGAAVQAGYERPERTPYDENEAARLTKNACARADAFLAAMELDPSIAYTLFFPPFSQLHYHVLDEAELRSYLAAKEHIVRSLAAYKNVCVYDFQSLPLTADLDNYCDQNHYGPLVNEYMTACFATGECRVDADTIRESNERLLERLANFRRDNAGWL